VLLRERLSTRDMFLFLFETSNRNFFSKFLLESSFVFKTLRFQKIFVFEIPFRPDASKVLFE